MQLKNEWSVDPTHAVFPSGLFVRMAWVLVCLAHVTAAVPEPSGLDILEGPRLFELHRFSDATQWFQARLTANPGDAEALVFLGRIAFEQNRLSDAIGYFEKAEIASPTNSAVAHWLGRACGIQARDLGPPRGIGPARRTRKSLERAVQLDPNNLDARVDLATFYRQAPMIVGGSKRGATTQLEEISRRDAYLGALVKGDQAMDDKRFDQAESFYKDALQRVPGKTDAYFRLGILYQRAARYEDAFASFEKLLAIAPEDKPTLFQIGKTADLSGHHLEKGEAALKKYLECQPFYIMPKLSWAHRRLGNIYLKKRQIEPARQQYRIALQLTPDDREAAAALRQLEVSSPESPSR